MESKKNGTNELMKHTHRQRKKTYGYQRERKGRDKVGVCALQIYTTTYIIDN